MVKHRCRAFLFLHLIYHRLQRQPTATIAANIRPPIPGCPFLLLLLPTFGFCVGASVLFFGNQIIFRMKRQIKTFVTVTVPRLLVTFQNQPAQPGLTGFWCFRAKFRNNHSSGPVSKQMSEKVKRLYDRGCDIMRGNQNFDFETVQLKRLIKLPWTHGLPASTGGSSSASITYWMLWDKILHFHPQRRCQLPRSARPYRPRLKWKSNRLTNLPWPAG